MKYVFGPVASRRFGMSLGIDVSPHVKSCNFDCVYCELSKAKKTDTIIGEPKVKKIIDEVKVAINKYKFDILTITANGEPTLYSKLDTLVDELKEFGKKLLILSNSSTIQNPHIQYTLSKIDTVKLSLDTVNPKTFKKINRPLDGIQIEDIIRGITDFSKIHKKDLVIEILVVKGINDNINEFKALNEVLAQINPTRVDISTIDRPPAYHVKAVEWDKLYKLSQEIKDQNVLIPNRKNLDAKKVHFSKDDLINTLKKRPFTKNDIESIFDLETKKTFLELFDKNIIKIKNISNVTFYYV
ncbi:MAG: radical SAM protein [Epsilonproteobacteria bacterium]|nr:radical SAM protein [Campylobacterota bacterium]